MHNLLNFWPSCCQFTPLFEVEIDFANIYPNSNFEAPSRNLALNEPNLLLGSQEEIPSVIGNSIPENASLNYSLTVVEEISSIDEESELTLLRMGKDPKISAPDATLPKFSFNRQIPKLSCPHPSYNTNFPLNINI